MERAYKLHHRMCPTCRGAGEIRMVFGERLRAIRNDRNLSQEEMAGIIGLTRSQVANLEATRSDPTVPTLVAVARGLGVSVDFLLGVSVGGQVA